MASKNDRVFIDAKFTRETPPRKPAENIDEEELNRILDKISKSGYDSLSKQEKRRLFTASQKMSKAQKHFYLCIVFLSLE